MLAAAIAFASVVTLGSELLSLAGWIRSGPVLVLWLTAAGAAFAAARRSTGVERQRVGTRPLPEVSWMVVPITVLLSAALLAGLLTTPSSYDAMVYHLPRQVRWIQQASLDHFPTHIPLQLYREPFAEMLSAELFLLTGSDRAPALVQWAALVGCLLAVSLIAANLGTGPRGQVFSAFLVASAPLVFLQASTSKNDLVFAFWFLAVVCLIQRSRGMPERSPVPALLLGAAFGLMMLTKGAGSILGLPLAAWTVTAVLREKKGPSTRRTLILIALPLLLLNAGHWARNWVLFGSPGPPRTDRELMMNNRVTPAGYVCR
jgi:4-amino-4-deoxy-L-arabinose transferase-like glycosyltransferase